ncbi:MAG: prepilin-type N-terminal cleavage/methylation domain-containing protein [Deltaproteobacteria bacterium]|nr:MAG: prepilin-type N-terminal cleavage/methylation domain-containing protein [Deltaproteobacteria bacterium]
MTSLRHPRQHRRGITLIEVMVTVALLVVVAGILLFSMDRLFGLQQSRAARQIGVTYELLHDQAILHNATFRIAFHLDESRYSIEVGEGKTLIFSDPEARERYEDELDAKLRMFTDEEKEEHEAGQGKFAKLSSVFDSEVKLPGDTVIARVYTPQYGEWIEPEEDEDEPTVAYSYIFPNGFAEPVVIHLARAGQEDDEEEGYTIWVESLSGRVHTEPGLRHWRELQADVPDDGPELP